MSKSKTPETDAQEYEAYDHLGRVVPVEFARKLEIERDEWKDKFIQQNKDLGCEMMDPNGTIWDYAKKLEIERDELNQRLQFQEQLSKEYIDRHTKLEIERDEAREQLQEERELTDRLAESLLALSKICPTVGCEEMHHPKHYQHGDDDPCPVLRLYNEARRDACHKIESWKEARKL